MELGRRTLSNKRLMILKRLAAVGVVWTVRLREVAACLNSGHDGKVSILPLCCVNISKKIVIKSTRVWRIVFVSHCVSEAVSHQPFMQYISGETVNAAERC